MFKFGQVTPLLTKPGADDKDMVNCWPTTNLNTIGKIIERLSQNQIRRLIRDSPNVGPLQSAYRALHSTETAVTRVVNDLLSATDIKTPSVLLSLDINAAFDILDRRRLSSKRSKNLFGLDDIILEWLRSCLTGRTQYVTVGDCRSIAAMMTSGVSQGSILGPLLFSMFTALVGILINLPSE